MSNKLNSILTLQNQPRQLDRLAAQRCLYSQAKKVLLSQTLLTVAGGLIFAVLAIMFQSLKAWATFYGICASILDAAFLEPRQKVLRQQAALIQEDFDCEVLGLDWPDWKAGQADPEIIHGESCRYKKGDPNSEKIRDWYTFDFAHLPLSLARVICQRASVGYDVGLRRSYRKWVTIILVVLFVALFAFSLMYDLNLSKFILTALAPFSPAILWGIREWKKQTEAIDALDRLKKQADGLWKEVLLNPESQTESQVKSRRLQDEIFERRKSNSLIFDWIYHFQRYFLEAQMRQMGSERVKEAEMKLELRN